MLILRLNSNKELSYTNTTSIYSNENNFDTIRIVASPTVNGKSIMEYKVELYIYNVLNQGWNTFNDCILCDFVSENNKYTFEIPIKSQYTTCPRLGFYFKFTNQDGVVGKTNVVETPILYHNDNTIDVDNSIQVFEKYKKNILKNASDVLYDSYFIYFKKECDNWDTPRIYFFNKEYSEGQIDFESWVFNDSPYMLQNEDGYYYYPRIKGYDNVIFFCDKTDSGWNYKTNDLTIPASTWYKTPLFVQSEIGYDGFWADYNTKTTKLLVQLDWTTVVPNVYRDSNISAEYVSDEIKTVSKICDFGMVRNGVFNTEIRNPYKYIELPIDFIDLSITFNGVSNNTTYTKNYNLKRLEICYEYPVAYCGDLYDNSYNLGLHYFNAYVDENLKYKLDNGIKVKSDLYCSSAAINNLNTDLRIIKQNLDVSYGDTGNISVTTRVAGDDYTVGCVRTRYYKIGKLITCFFYYNLSSSHPDLEDIDSILYTTNGKSVLPYAMSSRAYSNFKVGIHKNSAGKDFYIEIDLLGRMLFVPIVSGSFNFSEYFNGAKGSLSFSYYID